MEKVTVLAYKFNDLSPEAQNRAIELNREIDLPDNLFDFDEDGYIEYANQKGFIGLNVYEYDLSQGYCSIEFEDIDIEKILADKNIKHKSILIKIYKEYAYITWYRHTLSVGYNWGPKDYPRIEKQMDLLSTILSNKTRDLERDIIDLLREQYYYLISDSNVKEVLINNECLFTSTGDPFKIELKDVISRANILDDTLILEKEETQELCKEIQS